MSRLVRLFTWQWTACLILASVLFGQARYEPDWKSLDTRPMPQWFPDAKFGILIHWGVYSVPAWAPTKDVGVYEKYAEWYWRRLNDKTAAGEQFRAFHRKMYGDDFKYQDFVKYFKGQMFDPERWADVIAHSGARYVVLTSKHHDGFCLWQSKFSWNWNSVDTGPHRDIVGELSKAVRAKGLKMGLYYSLYEWYHPFYLSDVNRYVEEHVLPQFKELVEQYQPDLIWADGEWEHPDKTWRSEEFLAWLFNESSVGGKVVINDRWGKGCRGKHGGFYTSEYGISERDKQGGRLHVWEECRGIGNSAGYNRNEKSADYSTSESLVYSLVETVSEGGNFLLDIGPDADGLVPVIMEERINDIGEWLKVNGEAIYGTRPWGIRAEDSKVRYTSRDDAVYAISLGWPGKILVLDVSKPLDDTMITMLGRADNLPWKYKDGRMHIDVSEIRPNELPCRWAYAFKINRNIKSL